MTKELPDLLARKRQPLDGERYAALKRIFPQLRNSASGSIGLI